MVFPPPSHHINLLMEGVVSKDSYDPHNNASTISRATFGFEEDWILYLCPQSAFKLHPLFDFVIRRIVERSTSFNGHIIFIEGRRESWTEKVKKRMKKIEKMR